MQGAFSCHVLPGTRELHHDCFDSDQLAEIAEALAAGKCIPGWHLDWRGIVSHYVVQDVFWNPALVCNLIYSGFEPGGASIDMYVRNRVIEPRRVKAQRRTLRRLTGTDSRRYVLKVDSGWEQVVRRVQENTWSIVPGDCWLSDNLAASLKAASYSDEAKQKHVAFHCVELWFGDDMIAANIGYTVGFIYSGLTKFYLKDDKRHSGAGIMMSTALGAWLHKKGFTLYAMGQDAPYKSQGVLQDSYILEGTDWLEQLKTARVMDNPPSLLPHDGCVVHVEDLVKGHDATSHGLAEPVRPAESACQPSEQPIQPADRDGCGDSIAVAVL